MHCISQGRHKNEIFEEISLKLMFVGFCGGGNCSDSAVFFAFYFYIITYYRNEWLFFY